jgi:hypothetical protein
MASRRPPLLTDGSMVKLSPERDTHPIAEPNTGD